ncbi:major facilitator superfamily domain-containing protein [Trametes maxima]|nr:major facilitator superfamily domain-containing protein [Trametes maxima]
MAAAPQPSIAMDDDVVAAPAYEKGDPPATPATDESKTPDGGSEIVHLPSLEKGQPVGPNGEIVQTPAMRRKSRLQFAALCCSMFVAGWNDGTLGPLLPRLQEVYNIGYAVVSLIFVVSCVGAIGGMCSFLYLTDRLAYGTVVVAASLLMMVAYALEAAAVPFPVFVVAYFFIGCGGAFLNSGSNVFLASVSLGKASTRFGMLHASYGRPFASQVSGLWPRPSSRRSSRDSPTGHSCISSTSDSSSSRPSCRSSHSGSRAWNISIAWQPGGIRTYEYVSLDCAQEIGQPPPDKQPGTMWTRYKRAFSIRVVHMMALFAFIYVGVEVSIGSWIVTYIINLRHGGPNSGYISSGLYGGLMLGRVVLMPISKLVGERRVPFLYLLLVIGLQLVVWLVPSLIADAVCVSLVGFFLGPLFPIMSNHSGRIIPPDLISGALGWISSWGAAGAAVFPFITGAIASKTGIKTLQPLVVALTAVLIFIWACIPRSRRQIQG